MHKKGALKRGDNPLNRMLAKLSESDLTRRDAKALDSNSGQHVLSCSESRLLFQRQRIDQRFDIRQFTAPVLAL